MKSAGSSMFLLLSLSRTTNTGPHPLNFSTQCNQETSKEGKKIPLKSFVSDMHERLYEERDNL